MRILWLMALASGLAAPAIADDAPALPDRGGVLALSCAACHGTDGNSPGAMPSLQEQSMAFIRNRMLAFQLDKRPSTVMGRIARGYTAEEISLIAQHFADLGKEKKP